MNKKIILSLVLAMISSVIFSTVVFADGVIIPEPPICDPGPCFPGPIPISQLEIRYHHVDVTIENQVAVTHVDQVFYNPNDWAVEGTYVFPIPVGATVSEFVLWIDGEPVQGEILTADEARRTYEEIVRELQDPALLEYARQGAVKAQVFPIPPGGERRIELKYAEVLTAENGLVRYLYPLNTEKFSTRPLDAVRVSVDIRANQPIRATYSPSHPIALRKAGDLHVTVGYEESNVKSDSDFVLYYSIGESEAFHLLSYRDPSEETDSDGFFMVLLAPRPVVDITPVPKDVILVLDRSGSMEGEKFSQAQAALKNILQNLNPEDRFNVISFSTGSDSYAPTLQSISEINSAVNWVNRQAAVGSTDINRALLEASAVAEAERPTYLIFLTDGLPTEGVIDSQQIIANFAQNAPANIRLFSFGVGYDVDTFLLDSLAKNHQGASTYVLPGEPLDEILSAFYAKISTPVLTDLELSFGELNTFDIYPNPLPDLFVGSQIIAVGRYRDGGSTDIILTGMVTGESQTFTFPNQIFTADSRTLNSEIQTPHFLPRLWATRKIGYLLNQIRLHGPEQELVDQIVRLSIRYGIVTPYTSFLVTEPAPLGAAEQNRIAEDQFMAMEAAPQAQTYGREAVEKATSQGELEVADSVSGLPIEAANTVKVVESRTFVLANGVWTDTGFDPDTMPTRKVAFLSDDYFSLVTARQNLAAAFALGSQVIAISDGIAYEIISADQIGDSIDIPSDLDSSPPPVVSTENTNEEIDSSNDPELTTQTEIDEPEARRNNPCLGGLLPLILVPFGIFAFRFQEFDN
jgi:Ca-activated chloride channel homolog